MASGAVPTRRMERAERREQIVHAARDVFVEHGFAGARTQQIAERADVTEALIYKHFDSKRALFEAAVLEPVEAMIGELAEQADELAAEAEPAARRRRLVAMNEVVCRTCVQVVPLLGVALFAEGGRDFYRRRLAPVLDRAYRDTEEVLGSWPVRRAIDGRTAFTMTFGMHLGMALDAHMRGEALDVAAVSAALADVVVRGVSEGASGPPPSLSPGSAPVEPISPDTRPPNHRSSPT